MQHASHPVVANAYSRKHNAGRSKDAEPAGNSGSRREGSDIPLEDTAHGSFESRLAGLFRVFGKNLSYQHRISNPAFEAERAATISTVVTWAYTWTSAFSDAMAVARPYAIAVSRSR